MVALAEQGQAPAFLAYIDRRGRPVFAIIVASCIGLVAYVGATDKQETAFNCVCLQLRPTRPRQLCRELRARGWINVCGRFKLSRRRRMPGTGLAGLQAHLLLPIVKG